MKLKSIILVVMMSLMTTTALAGDQIKVSVKGMVCGFCAQGIEKKFKAEPSVEKIEVSLKEKIVTLDLKEGQTLEDEKIKKTLIDSGYTVEKIERK